MSGTQQGYIRVKSKMPNVASPYQATFIMKTISTSLLVEPTEFHPDGLVNRSPDLDSFTRPVSSTHHVLYDFRPDIIEGIHFDDSYPHDTAVLDMMEQKPCLQRLLNSLVFIRIQFSGPNGTSRYGEGSGALVGRSLVFTCAHVLGNASKGDLAQRVDVFISADDMKNNRFGINAEQVGLDPNLLSLYDYPGDTTDDQIWGLQDPDFAVLKLDSPVERSEDQLLTVPRHFRLPNPRLLDGEIVCIAGLPHPETQSASYSLRTRLVRAIKAQHPADWERLVERLVENCCFRFEGPMVCFGAIDRSGNDLGQIYIRSSASTFEGISGGPVVNLSNPTELLGFCVGGAKQGFHTVFFRADSPLVIEAFGRFSRD